MISGPERKLVVCLTVHTSRELREVNIDTPESSVPHVKGAGGANGTTACTWGQQFETTVNYLSRNFGIPLDGCGEKNSGGYPTHVIKTYEILYPVIILYTY
jgi:hypothetical protein